MRMRPVGPAIGGLNDSSMLQDAYKGKRASLLVSPAPGKPVAAPGGQLRAAWLAVVAAAQRAGGRIKAARMAQAQALISDVTRRCATDAQPGRAPISRYY